MRIVFSMDGIKNMDQLYTWEKEQDELIGCDAEIEHYHGDKYCGDIVSALKDWPDARYIGSRDRIANETFFMNEKDDYILSFAIDTYSHKIAHMEVTITAQNTGDYDQKLEKLKIDLKNTLLPDWQECTWLLDEQSAVLCKEAYEQAHIIENKLRAFASKVLIHFLGVSWLRRAGLEKQAESVKNLKDKFTQRVPDFDDINTDFLSMTLETLVGIMFEGVVYKDDVILSRQQYEALQGICSDAKSASSVAEYVRARRTVDKNLWTDLFVPFVDDPEAFKTATHNFIEDRNHVAHSKVLSWSSYQVILRDFQEMEKQIRLADEKFDTEETSEEVLATWEAEQDDYDDPEYETEYIRDRISLETGMNILDESAIEDWFDEILLDKLYDDIYQHYHLDVCFEISDYSGPSEESLLFSISCPVEEDGSLRIDVIAECSIDDELGGDSTCTIVARHQDGNDICQAEIHFHNGNGHEGENGLMEADENTEYDTSELDEFKEELIEAIDELNPYPAKLDGLGYESKGTEQFVADIPCEQCGKFGISVNEALLPIGKCCYCGYEQKLERCVRCGELVSSLEHGLCPTCASYVDKQ